VISLVLVVMAWDEVWATFRYLQRVWRATRDVKTLWQVFWGRREAAAQRVALATEAA